MSNFDRMNPSSDDYDLPGPKLSKASTPHPETPAPLRGEAYELVDRFLRNNLGDMDYAEYSQALDLIYGSAPQEASKPEVGGMNEYDLLDEWLEAAGLCFDGVGDCNTTGPVRRMDILQLIRVARDLKLPAASKEASKAAPVADEREAFDVWFRADRGLPADADTGPLDSAYLPWRAWKARAAIASQPEPTSKGVQQIDPKTGRVWNDDMQRAWEEGREFGRSDTVAASQQRALSDEEIVAILKACKQEDHTKEGWIWRQRIRWARAILAAASGSKGGGE